MSLTTRGRESGPNAGDADQAETADAGEAAMMDRARMQRALQRRRARQANEKPAVDPATLAQALVTIGWRDVNVITDQVFWSQHPDLLGQKLESGSEDAVEWLRIRDEHVRPAVKAAPPLPHAERKAAEQKPPENAHAAAASSSAAGASSAASAATGAATAGATTSAAAGSATGTAATTATGHASGSAATTAAGGAPTSNPNAGGASASGGAAAAHDPDHEAYRTQNDNTFGMSEAASKNGGSSGYTCNMTSLAMSLISMCGGDEQKARLATIAALKKRSLPAETYVRIGGKVHPISEVLDNPGLVSHAQLEDLLTVLAIEGTETIKGHKHGQGDIKSVTDSAVILKVAQETGIATGSEAWDGKWNQTPQGRERVKQKLAQGERIILGTPNHYIYLVDVLDDGLLVHDPAGARISPQGVFFLGSGGLWQVTSKWLPMLAKHPEFKEVCLRRTSKNPEAHKIAQKLVEIADMDEEKRAVEAKKLANGGAVNMGERNFYGTDEFAAYELQIRLELKAMPTGSPAA